MVTKDGIRTLTNVVIVNPTHGNFVSLIMHNSRITTSNAVQTIKKNYHDQHHTNQFLPLAIEVFGCSHKQADVFLHDCADVI